MTTAEAAKKWNCNEKYVSNLCQSGKIPSATKSDDVWTIPDDAVLPLREKVKSMLFVFLVSLLLLLLSLAITFVGGAFVFSIRVDNNFFDILFACFGVLFALAGSGLFGFTISSICIPKAKIPPVIFALCAMVAVVCLCVSIYGKPLPIISSRSPSSPSHSCHVCRKSASIKYGSFYYCTTHYAMVKTVTES